MYFVSLRHIGGLLTLDLLKDYVGAGLPAYIDTSYSDVPATVTVFDP